MIRPRCLLGLLGLAFAALAGAQPLLEHVHGLGFSADGSSLLVSSHRGLAAYRDSHWSDALEAPYDFTGFSIAERALYASGHPAPGSTLPNPLGLARSTDGGMSWSSVALGGEADFHFIAASYRTPAIYVVAHLPNRAMPQPGIYATRHEGKAWRRAPAQGLPRTEILALAAHPDAPDIVAVGTERGLYISLDEGQRFRRIDGSGATTAVAFDLDGRRVRYAPALSSFLIASAIDGAGTRRTALPPLGLDFVTHIAQHPRESGTLAIATRRRDIYMTNDAGKTWRALAREGDLP